VVRAAATPPVVRRSRTSEAATTPALRGMPTPAPAMEATLAEPMVAELAIAARQQRRAETAERRLERQERARLRRVAAATRAAANAEPVGGAVATATGAAGPDAQPAPDCDTQPVRCLGTVKWFNDDRGYGFIGGDNGRDLFVHCSAIAIPGFRTLREGQAVEYEEQLSPKGLQAVGVMEPEAGTL